MAKNAIFLPHTALLRTYLEYKCAKIMGKSQKRVTLFLRVLENRLMRNSCQEFSFFHLEYRDLKKDKTTDLSLIKILLKEKQRSTVFHGHKVSSNINRVFIKRTVINGSVLHQVWNRKFFATRDN